MEIDALVAIERIMVLCGEKGAQPILNTGTLYQ